MTEFQELVKDAPKFASMERGELVAYAYAMCAAGAKTDAENAKLRELAKGLMGHVMHPPCEGCMAEMNCDCSDLTQCDEWLLFEADASRLGVEVD